MAETARSIYPAGQKPGDPASEMVLEATGGDLRGLQRKLWVAAKRSPGRRFHALFDRIYRSDVLLVACQYQFWTRAWFEAHGLYRLRGTVRYPVAAS